MFDWLNQLILHLCKPLVRKHNKLKKPGKNPAALIAGTNYLNMASITRLLFFLSGIMFALPAIPMPVSAQQKVTLQLKWSHCFQFAGYYAAKEKGFYKAEGLDVTILAASPGTNPVDDVIQGKAQFAVGTSNLLLDRNAGKPVVVLAVIFQHSPYEIYAAPGIQHLHDLIGKRIMLEPQSQELLAFLQKSGISPDSVFILPHSFDAEGLMCGETDAISGYMTNEPYFFRKAQYPYQTFNPRIAGIDFYGDNLFTSEQEIQSHPEQVKAFRAASLKGWEYAETHQEEIIDLIISKYKTEHSHDYLHFEADQMVRLIQFELIETGYMNPKRWQKIVDTYTGIGLLPKGFSLDGFIYNTEEEDMKWLYKILLFSVLILVVFTLVAAHILNVNRKLANSIKKNKITTDALAESEELWRTVVKTSPDGIAITSLEGEIQQVSDSLLAMMGYSSLLEIIGQSVFGFVDETYRTLALNRLEDVFHDKKSGSSELKLIRKNGSRFYVESNVAILKNAAGENTNLIHIVRDISKRKSAETELKKLTDEMEQRIEERTAELKAAITELETFSYTASHDLRTPLRALDGFANILLQDYSTVLDDEAKRMLNIIIANANKMGNLIDDLLSFSRFGRLEIKHSEINMFALARSVFLEVTTEAEREHIDFICHDIQPAFGDKAMIELVWVNLIGNAVKFSKHKDRIQIVIDNKIEGDECIYSISDNGIGFDASESHKLFGVFKRLNNNRLFEGTGVGLAIVNRVIKKHNGKVWAEGKLNEGATFFFTIGTKEQL